MARIVRPTYPNVNAQTLEGVERAARIIDQVVALVRGALRAVSFAVPAARAAR